MDALLVEVNKKALVIKLERRGGKGRFSKTTGKDSSSVISDLTHCEEDLPMTSTEPATLPEQASVGTSPVKSSMADKQVPASKSYEDADTECQQILYNQQVDQDLRREHPFALKMVMSNNEA
ncbi:unnamed protein product [Rhizophagus irregularis]|nr:unnamed protein product [Rhizophagus irregularis]CAB4440894.1 unnamed protein product [Rhizophagus irregularis]